MMTPTPAWSEPRTAIVTGGGSGLGKEIAKALIAKGLEGISLWAAMLHSWLGMRILPRFDLDGRMIES